MADKLSKEKVNNGTYIYGLSVLKFLAMALIVWWHLGKPTGSIDLGARMCEFLFIASGFLVAFNNYNKENKDSWSASFKYVYKKIRVMWPLHVLMLVCVIVLQHDRYITGFVSSDIPNFLVNLFLLQAWSPNVGSVCFAYNGVSWFLSALLFCYLISHLFQKFCNNKKTSIIMFILIALLRFLLEFNNFGYQIFGLAVHTSPIVRGLEFFMGMLLVPSFMSLKNRLSKISNKSIFRIAWTFFELGLIFLICFLMYKFNDVWIRDYFVLMFCFFVFFIAFDYSYLSKICSNKFVLKLSSIQLEVYLAQIVVQLAIDYIFSKLGWSISIYYLFIIEFITILLFAVFYKFLLEKTLAKLLDKCVDFIKKIFISNKVKIEEDAEKK